MQSSERDPRIQTTHSPFPEDLQNLYIETLNRNRTHFEVIRSLDPTIRVLADRVNTPPQEMWQPSDFLPDPRNREAVEEFQRMAAGVPDFALAILVGNAITEEGLPHFFQMIHAYATKGKQQGDPKTALEDFTVIWTGQEHRHGVVFHGYSYLTGRVNMRAFEESTQEYLINGVDTRTGEDPYEAIVYVSFQERAAKISHRNLGTVVKRAGDKTLASICGKTAGEEDDHEMVYKPLMGAIFDEDPDDAMIAFNNMMEKKIAMPGASMPFFDPYAAVAHANGIYTAQEYVDIYGHLLDYWKIRERTVASEGAKKAQIALVKRHEEIKDRLDSIMTRRLQREYRGDIIIPWVNSPLSIQNPDTFLRELKRKSASRRQETT